MTSRLLLCLLLAGCQPTVPAIALTVCGLPAGAVAYEQGEMVFLYPEEIPDTWRMTEIVELSPEESIVQQQLESCDIGEEEMMEAIGA